MEEETMETTIPAFLTQNMNSSSSSTSATTTTTTTTTSLEVQKSLHVLRRSRRRCMEGGKEVAVEEKEKDEDEDEGSDDREEIERKINALQRIVPNGESYGVDKLFDETAGYIVALQYQVKALKALTGFFQKMEKDKTKLGG